MSSHPQGLFCPISPPVCGIGWKRSTTSLSRCYTEYEKIAGKNTLPLLDTERIIPLPAYF
nr:MAG TPA: hypothetical protein [Caudoviricetes sp.]DAG32349.1 MAG TPA: hypothetical protein [Caudoviricetes sp.]